MQLMDKDDPHVTPLPRLSQDTTQEKRDEYISIRIPHAVNKIQKEREPLQKQVDGIQASNKLPKAVQGTMEANFFDAIGTLYAHVQSIEGQRDKTKAKGWFLEQGDLVRALDKALTHERQSLETATKVGRNEWKITVSMYIDVLPSSPEEAKIRCETLPLAATDPELTALPDHELTVQRLLGIYVVQGDTTMSNVVLEIYNQRRSVETGQLVSRIMRDVIKYDAALTAALEDVSANEASEKLRAMEAEHVPQQLNGKILDDTMIQQLTGLDGVTNATSVLFALQARLDGTTGSIQLYEMICGIVSPIQFDGPTPFVVPGGVKQLPRMVFKTITKYRCAFTLCKDVIRCTVVTTTIVLVSQVAQAILDSPDIIVIRMKHRLHRGYDAAPIGGYRDVQFQVIFKAPDGQWHYGEVQINLEAMVAIKQNPNGGHAIFKFARSLAAYDAKTFEYTGPWTRELNEHIQNGVLLKADLVEGGCGKEGVPQLLRDALLSPTCRLRDLK